MNANQVIPASESVLSKRSFTWAGVAALTAGCAACCAVPLLVAAGVGGGLLATLAGIQPWTELAIGAAAATVLGVTLARRRTKQARECGDASALPTPAGTRQSIGAEAGGSAGCGCAPFTAANTRVYTSPSPAAEEPIVCTADLGDKPTIQAQIDGYRAAFAHLVDTERFPGGFRWVFRKAPGLESQLQQLAANEHQCCRFFQFDVSVIGERVLWETSAGEHAGGVLEEFSRMPERLREEPLRGHDVAALKRSVDAAGLVFAAASEPVK